MAILLFVIMLLLWYITYDCNKWLSNRIPKQAVLIFSGLIYLIFVLIYAYIYKEECVQGMQSIDIHTFMHLLLIPFTGFVTSLLYIHAGAPSFYDIIRSRIK